MAYHDKCEQFELQILPQESKLFPKTKSVNVKMFVIFKFYESGIYDFTIEYRQKPNT